MQAGRKRPISVALSDVLIRTAAGALPVHAREEWIEERSAEAWHRWQFLEDAGAWGRREAMALVYSCLASCAQALWRVIADEVVRSRIREGARSPWLYLGVLGGVLAVLAVLTSGFPATRQMLGSGTQSSHLLFIWRHPIVGGGDRGLPSDVVPAWAEHSRLLEGVAGFRVGKELLKQPHSTAFQPAVIVGDMRLFQVLKAQPLLGSLLKPGIVLDHRTWSSIFHGKAEVVGSRVPIGEKSFRVVAVLPKNFYFLTRQPTIYLIQPVLTGPRVMVVARSRPGATKTQIDQELTRIAEDVAYYFFRSQLRLRFVESALLAPLVSFGFAAIIAALMILAACRPRLDRIRLAWRPENRRATAWRGAFFVAKLSLALAILFLAGLESSRTEASMMFGSRDPGSGPFLLWIYIAGAMGIFFWSVADQRARCRVCLRLLCFPVRIGCPGCLLLDWSGTELLCAQGHGILHVPHLAPTWDTEAEHWIALDDSWRDLFASTK